MNIKPHWCIVNPQGEVVGLSINDRSGAWADAMRASDESQAELVGRGCDCFLCQILVVITSDQRCGTCKFWELRDATRCIGWCNHPIPNCVDDETDTCMYSHNGINCPCYQRKERDERDGTD